MTFRASAGCSHGRGAQVVYCLKTHTHTHGHAHRTYWCSSQMLTLYTARFPDCQHLSHTRTHTCIHTYILRCPFTQDLSVAAILPCGGMCVKEWDIEVGALMNNAALNEEGDDGDRNTSSQEPVYTASTAPLQTSGRMWGIWCCHLISPPLITEAVTSGNS